MSQPNPFVAGQSCEVWHRATTHPYAMYKDCFKVGDAAHARRLYEHMLEKDPEWYPDQYWLKRVESTGFRVPMPEIKPFLMDGSEHAPMLESGCCLHLGKKCGCGGWMHYEPVYGGYWYECEECHAESL